MEDGKSTEEKIFTREMGTRIEIKRIEVNARLGVHRVEGFKRYQQPIMEDDTSANSIRSITVQEKIKICEIVESIMQIAFDLEEALNEMKKKRNESEP